MQEKAIMQLKSYLQLSKKQECRRLTLTGWLIIIICITVICIFIGRNAHVFLAITKPVASKILVVEGHVPDFTLDSVKRLVMQNNDTLIFTTGIPMTQGSYLCGYSNYADLTAASLYNLGLNTVKIISVPCNPKQRDRTYESAMALKRKLIKMKIKGGLLNILTTDTHARRTKLLFEEALGDSWQIGIISIKSTNYDTKKWWTSSFGMRAVIYEGLAWFYARFLFSPDNLDTDANRN